MSQPFSTIVVFGATGDLAQRMLLPSLYNLDTDGLLDDELRIYGAARSKLDQSGFRDQVAAALDAHLTADDRNAAVRERFLARLDYCAVDASNAQDFVCLADKVAARKNTGIAF